MNNELDDLISEYELIYEQVAAIEKVAIVICEKIYNSPVNAWYIIQLLSTAISGELVDEKNTEYPYYFEIPLTVFYSGIDAINEFIIQERKKLIVERFLEL